MTHLSNLTAAEELSSRPPLPGPGPTGTEEAQAQTSTDTGLGADQAGPSQPEVQPPEEAQPSGVETPPPGDVAPTATAQHPQTPGPAVATSSRGRRKPVTTGFGFGAPASSTSTVGGVGTTFSFGGASQASQAKPAAPPAGSFSFNIGGATGATGTPASGGLNLFGGSTTGAAATLGFGTSSNQASHGASATPGTGNLIFNLYGGTGTFTFEFNLGGGTGGTIGATSATGAVAGLFNSAGGAPATTTAASSHPAATGFAQRPFTSFSQPQQPASPFGASGLGGGFGAPTQPGAFGGSGFEAGPSSAGGFGAPGAYGAAVPIGTAQPVFQPLETTEKDAKTGRNIRYVYNSIGMMPQYEDKSAEELRWDDYQANLRGPQAGTGSGGASAPLGISDGFAQQLAAAAARLFGTAQPPATPFGQQPAANPGPFGSPAQPATGGFGRAQPASQPGPSSGPSELQCPAEEALYQCSICCTDGLAESEGILCKAKKNKRHFLCQGCFSGFVAGQCEDGLFNIRRPQGPDYPIYCCMAPHCEARHPVKDLAFTAREVALLSTDEAYGKYLRVREQDAMNKGRLSGPVPPGPWGPFSSFAAQSQVPTAVGTAPPSPLGQTQTGPGAAPGAVSAASSNGSASKPAAPASFSFTSKSPAPGPVAKPAPAPQPQKPVNPAFGAFQQAAQQQQQQQTPGSDPPVPTFGQQKPATTATTGFSFGAPASSTPTLFGSAVGTTPHPTAPTTTPSFASFGGATQAKPATSDAGKFTFNWGGGTGGTTAPTTPASGGLNLFGGSTTGTGAATTPAFGPGGTASAAGTPGAGASGQRSDAPPAAQQQQQSPGASSATPKSGQGKPATAGSPNAAPSSGHREADPSPPRPANSGLAPRLTLQGYSTEPPLEELWRYAPEQLAKIEGFTIKCKGLGEVRFLSDTDVRGLDLDAIVDFHSEPGNLRMYMQNEDAKPEFGRELKKRAQVTLYNVKKRQPGDDAAKIEFFF